jgi:excinuclease ABC subunit C
MMPRAVQSLQRDLRMEKPPRRIECFDNSNLQGTDPVSSMVCFVDGRPRRSEYRKFKVRTVVGADDFATMKEVVGRRYTRVMKEGWALPDLIVIDGGKGQVAAAMEVITELGLEHIPLIGLAKRLEEIVLPGQRDTLLLPRSSSSLRLLQQIRDEAHRFAITFHRTLRSRRTLQSELSNIPGVGPKTVVKIFEKFGSVRGVQAASLAELQEFLGPKTGLAVFEYFQAQKEENPETALPDVLSVPDTDDDEFDDVQLEEDEEGEEVIDDEGGDDEEDSESGILGGE